MDDRSFDEISRVAATASRRRALKVIGAGVAGWATGLLGIRPAGAQAEGTDCCPPEAPNLCELHCVDLSSDDDNCGACGNRCRGNTTCHEGTCIERGGAHICPDGMSVCRGTCVDLQTDADNCGDCGVTCANGMACLDGACAAPGACEPGQTLTCGTSDEGICQYGTQTCQSDGTWGPCEGAVYPRPETCNGLDDDCDGLVDEGDDLCPTGFSCIGGQCVSDNACSADSECGDCGFCDGGACRPRTAMHLCRAAAGPCDVAEYCDGVGFDCPPDRFANSGTVCRPAVSECDIAEYCDGTSAMCPTDAFVANGTGCTGGTCQEGICVSGGECLPGQTASCGSEVGECQFGTMTCQDNGTWGPCEGGVGPQPEICDGLDNDCDGLIDEDFDLQTDPQNCGFCGNVCPSGTCASGVCIAICGDGICEPDLGETCELCPTDCCVDQP